MKESVDVEERMGYVFTLQSTLATLGENLSFLATKPLPIHHSWPLYEKARHFGLGQMMNCAVTNLAEATELGSVSPRHSGVWVCDLADNSLIWSSGVYDIFGIPRGARVSRQEAAALYSEGSGAAMESLRAHAIEHRRGFTLDVEIFPVVGGRRSMRLIAAPVCDGDRVVRLHGLKFII
jgi:PAS domain-containing protein